jgi:uncharacterized membrane protein
MLLLLWILLGAGLRLMDLEIKPPWTEEFTTLVSSLGNSFTSVPLDRVIYFSDILAPLIPPPSSTVNDVIYQVVSEDRQPPLYLIIAHFWMKLFPTDGGLVNLWGARALAALFGILTIPIAYICSYLTFRSRTISNLTAAMLALSPYGIYIAQEARHYSLAIVWVTISISCLAIACGQLSQHQKLPIPIVIAWIVANNLGMATHYLFGIALITEILILGGFYLWQIYQTHTESPKSDLSIARDILLCANWRRVYLAIFGSAVGIVVGWWTITHAYVPISRAWIDNTPHKSIEIVNPLFQIIGALITMMSLLLVEVTEIPSVSGLSDTPLDFNLAIAIVSAVLMLIFFGWAMPFLKRGIRMQLQDRAKIETIIIGSFTIVSIGLYLVITWLTGIDITRGARYNFVYFPGIIMSIGLGLASCWQTKPSIAKWVSGKQAVAIVLIMGFMSSAIVSCNYGYHKYYRPEQIVPMIQQSAPKSVLIATTHNDLVQVGEMMGLAWEMQHRDKIKQTANVKFLLAHQDRKFCNKNCPTTKILRETVDRISRSIDLWAVNFHAPIDLPPTCNEDKRFTDGIYGYQYRLFHCQPIQDID